MLAFAGLGASGAGVPASLPAVAGALDAPPGAVLDAVPLLFAGLFAGVLLAPLLARRLALPRLVALGAAIQAAGLGAAAASSSSAEFVASGWVVGLGFGVVESGGVALARSLAPHAAERRLVALTGCVALAAAATPLLVAVLAAAGAVRGGLALLAVPHGLAAVALALAPRTNVRPGGAVAGVRATASRRVLLAATALFCYVGAESVLAGWSAVLPRRELDIGAATAALGTSAFWVLLTLGRACGLILLRLGRDPADLLFGSLVTAALLLLGATALSGPGALAAIGLAVVACGPCYALLIGLGSRGAAASAATSVSAALVAAGALGGVGLAAVARLSDLAVTLVPALAACAAAATAAGVRRLDRAS